MGICFNLYCGTTSSVEWKAGWPLQTGGFANLCVKCGDAYEDNNFCEKFHSEEPGWKECCICGKKLHTQCPSSMLLVLLGCREGVNTVKCRGCAGPEDLISDVGESSCNGKRDFSLVAPPECVHHMYIVDEIIQSPILGTSSADLYVLRPCPNSEMYGFEPASQWRTCYWPKVTDDELAQINRNPHCAILPLFEKELSASDTKTHRLVLPKTCAEAFFPQMVDSPGAPLTFLDVNGKEWEFRFKIWTNGNSKMYALDGVKTFIRTFKLEPRDIITFNFRIFEGIYVLGFRRSRSYGVQDAADHEEYIYGSREPGSKNKRIEWTDEETLSMLRPFKSVRPNVIVVDDYEFEEYDAPPIIGKKSVFTTDSSGMVEQWTKCDICYKWRSLPAEFLLADTWTCVENAWDSARNVCGAPEEANREMLEDLLQHTKGVRKNALALVNEVYSSTGTGSEELDASAAAATTPMPDTGNNEGLDIPAAVTVPKTETGTAVLIPKPETIDGELIGVAAAAAATPKVEEGNEELIGIAAATPKVEEGNEELIGIAAAAAAPPKAEAGNHEELGIASAALTPKLEAGNDEELQISTAALTPKLEPESDVPHIPEMKHEDAE